MLILESLIYLLTVLLLTKCKFFERVVEILTKDKKLNRNQTRNLYYYYQTQCCLDKYDHTI